MFKLVIADEEGGMNTIVPLLREEIIIGRKEGSTIRLTERNISRRHARLRKADGAFLIEDLESYNGVEVNGRKITQVLKLEAGDRIVIGDYRLELELDLSAVADAPTADVPAPDAPAPDAQTTEITALPEAREEEPQEEPNRKPLIIGGAIVVIAVIAAGVLVLLGDGEGEGMTVVEESDAPASEPGGDGTTAAGGGYQASLEACRAAVRGAQPAQALTAAAAALTAHPGDAAATACQTQANALRADEGIFQRGLAQKTAGQIEEAYFTFEQLPEESPFRGRPEVTSTMSEYADGQLTAASAVMENSPNESLRLARLVETIPGLPFATRTRAAALARAAESRVRQLPPEEQEGHRSRAGERPDRPDRPHSASTTRPSAAESDPSPTDTSPSGNPGGDSALVAAQACLARGDNRCAIRALRGHARTARELGLLIESYRQVGDQPAAAEEMRRYVQRFPSDVRSRLYRQLLARTGG